jgi:hypothetical protein
MTTPNQPFEGENLLQQITRHVFLTLLHISYPKLSYQIADAIVAVAGEDDTKKEIAEKFRSKPQWNLLPEEWRRKLGNLEGRARGTLDAASIHFAVRGIAVLPIARAGEIFAALRSFRAEMEAFRDEFTAEYESILNELKSELDEDLYARAARKLPDKDEIKKKFGIVWAIVPAGGSSIDISKLNLVRGHLVAVQALTRARGAKEIIDNAIAVIDELSTTAVQQITDDEASYLIGEARQQMAAFTKDMLEDIAKEPRKLLADAATNLLQAMDDPQRVIRTGTIEQVRRAFEMVEGFSFLAGPELLQRITEVRARIDDATPQQLNSNEYARSQLASALRGVRDVAADAQQASTLLRNFRRVNIRNPQPEETPCS